MALVSISFQVLTCCCINCSKLEKALEEEMQLKKGSIHSVTVAGL